MAEAELLIVPEIAVSDLRKTVDRLDRALKQSAKRAGDELEEEVERGLKAGIKRGARNMGDMFKRNAGGIAGGLAGVLAMGLGKAIADFDAGTALLEGRLGGENTAKILMAGADSLGMDAGSMGKIWQMARASGIDDPRDLLDLMHNVQLKTIEAETGEDPLMTQFKGKRGIELFTEVMGSMAQMDAGKRAYFLDKFEGGERLGEFNAMLSQVQAAGTPADWLKLTDADADRGLAMHKETKLADLFKQEQIRAEEARAQGELAAISGSTIKTWAQEQARITALNISVLKSYEENAQAAIPARELMEQVMKKTSEYVLKLVGLGERIAEGVDGVAAAMDAQNTGQALRAPTSNQWGGMDPKQR